MLSNGLVARNLSLSCLCLLRVKMLPFFPPFQHKGFGVFERFERPFPLNDIARLATGHEVIHFPCPAMGVRVNMINREDKPVCELV